MTEKVTREEVILQLSSTEWESVSELRSRMESRSYRDDGRILYLLKGLERESLAESRHDGHRFYWRKKVA